MNEYNALYMYKCFLFKSSYKYEIKNDETICNIDLTALQKNYII